MKKFEANEKGIDLMFEYFKNQIEIEGIEKYKINGDITPSTIFLAGAPGAGKTEFIETIQDNYKFIIIDIDKYRVLFEGYNGKNASEYQNLSTKVANKLYSYCIKNDLNIILDGTFGNINIINQNISMCKKKQRDFGVVLIYQDPLISYYYTKLREKQGKRNVPKEIFIKKFLNSIKNSFEIKSKYPEMFFLFAYKNSRGVFSTKSSVVDRKSFDKKVGFNYNESVLKSLLENLDELFNKKSTFKNKIIFIFKSLMNILGLKKKENKKKNNSKN